MQPAEHPGPRDASAIVWRVHRRPSAPYRRWAAFLAAIVGAAGGGLMRMLLVEPSWPLPLAVGLGVAAAFMLTAGRGGRASIDARGVLRYGWGARPSVAVDLGDVRAVRQVHAGLLHGIGLEIAHDRVRFLHRAGPTRRSLVEHRARLGVDLVLEFLLDEDAAEIERRRTALTG